MTIYPTSAKRFPHFISQEHIHVRSGGFYRCSYCRYDTMHSHEILAHMKNEHGVNGRLVHQPLPFKLMPPKLLISFGSIRGFAIEQGQVAEAFSLVSLCSYPKLLAVNLST